MLSFFAIAFHGVEPNCDAVVLFSTSCGAFRCGLYFLGIVRCGAVRFHILRILRCNSVPFFLFSVRISNFQLYDTVRFGRFKKKNHTVRPCRALRCFAFWFRCVLFALRCACDAVCLRCVLFALLCVGVAVCLRCVALRCVRGEFAVRLRCGAVRRGAAWLSVRQLLPRVR